MNQSTVKNNVEGENNMKTLCVYYSRTGMTEQIAREIAAGCGADLLRITDGKDRSGFFGYCAAAMAGLRKKLPVLQPYSLPAPLAEYDRVIVLSPIWCENVCPVIRAFLAAEKEQLRGEVYGVITHMSALPYDKPRAALAHSLGREALPGLSVQTRKHDWHAEVQNFIAGL